MKDHEEQTIQALIESCYSQNVNPLAICRKLHKGQWLFKGDKIHYIGQSAKKVFFVDPPSPPICEELAILAYDLAEGRDNADSGADQERILSAIENRSSLHLHALNLLAKELYT